MTEFYAVLVIIAVFAGILWLGFRAAKSQGRAEANLDAAEEARKTEQDMADAQNHELSDDDLVKRYREREGS